MKPTSLETPDSLHALMIQLRKTVRRAQRRADLEATVTLCAKCLVPLEEHGEFCEAEHNI